MSAAGTISLRPLNTGELLDRTITLYRRHFVLFVGIMAVPNVFLVAIVAAFALMAFAIGTGAGAGAGSDGAEAAAVLGIGLAVMMLLVLAGLGYWLAYVLAQGATTYAVSEIYLGRRVGILQSYNVVKSKLLRLIGLTLLLGVSMVAGFLLCIVPFFWVLLRTALSIPAAVIEDRPVTDAIERSIALTKGSWVRVLLVFLLATALNWAATAVLRYPFEIAAAMAGGGSGVAMVLQLVGLVGNVIAGTLTAPIAAIALALIYYDERVRKEGFDLQYMMAALDAGAPPAAAGAPPAPAAPPPPPEAPPPPPAPIG